MGTLGKPHRVAGVFPSLGSVGYMNTICARDVTEPAKIRGFRMQNPSDADADLSPDQNSLVPAIIATAIQLSYYCVRL